MLSVAELAHIPGLVAEGQYKVTNTAICAGSAGPYMQVTLADYSGTFQANARLQKNPWLTDLRTGTLIWAKTRPRQFNDQTVATLERFQSLSREDVINPAALIPHSDVPPVAHQALAQLVKYLGQLSRPESHAFMRTLLLDPKVNRPGFLGGSKA
tara:strand:- start:10 stop:474 length:465 start_codon:yes stop_codon:yes gene_type:complete